MLVDERHAARDEAEAAVEPSRRDDGNQPLTNRALELTSIGSLGLVSKNAAIIDAMLRRRVSSNQNRATARTGQTRTDLATLQAGQVVARRLRDPSIRSGLERVFSRRRAPPRETATGTVSSRPTAPPPPPTMIGIDNLSLLAGASFELLLSMQRRLEQQVSASLRQPSGEQSEDEGDGTRSTTLATVAKAREVLDGASKKPRRPASFRLGTCIVCCEAEVATVFYRCGHMCACAGCAHNLKQRRAQCPVCRAPIRDVVQAFLAGRDDDDDDEL